MPGAEDRAAAGDAVERRPLEREVQRVAGRRDHAGRAEPDACGALRDRRQQRDRLVARLREQAVADPDGVEAAALDLGRQVEQHGEVVVGRDQRLAVVEVDAELERSPRSRVGLRSASGRCAGPRRSATRGAAAAPGRARTSGGRRARRRRASPRAGSPRARRPSAAGCRAASATASGSGPSGRAAGGRVSSSFRLPDSLEEGGVEGDVRLEERDDVTPLGVPRHRCRSGAAAPRSRRRQSRGTASRTAIISSASRTW